MLLHPGRRALHYDGQSAPLTRMSKLVVLVWPGTPVPTTIRNLAAA